MHLDVESLAVWTGRREHRGGVYLGFGWTEAPESQQRLQGNRNSHPSARTRTCCYFWGRPSFLCKATDGNHTHTHTLRLFSPSPSWAHRRWCRIFGWSRTSRGGKESGQILRLKAFSDVRFPVEDHITHTHLHHALQKKFLLSISV